MAPRLAADADAQCLWSCAASACAGTHGGRARPLCAAPAAPPEGPWHRNRLFQLGGRRGIRGVDGQSPALACCLCSDYVTSVEFADDHTLVSADGGGKAKVWSIATGEEKTEALAGSNLAL